MSQGNHLNLDLGSHQILYLDRAKLGAKSTDVRTEDGSRVLTQMACLEQGIIKKFLHSGKEMQLLNPKKDELDLWTVVIHNDNGESSWRLDLILGSQRATQIQPGQQVHQAAAADGEYIPVDE